MTGSAFWQVLGWLAFALNIWGNLALTTRGTRGWLIRIASNACWIPYGLTTSAWALTANHALFAGINAYGWWKWTVDARKVHTPWGDATDHGSRDPTQDRLSRRIRCRTSGLLPSHPKGVLICHRTTPATQRSP